MTGRNILLLAVLLALTCLYTWYDDGYGGSVPPAKTFQAPETNTQSKQRAPDFGFTTLEGTAHRLSDFKGRVVILNFWASWCAPCVVEFPQMLDLAKMTEGKSVLLFLSQDESEEDIKRFLKKYAPELPHKNIHIALDRDQKIARSLYQTYKLPETYLIAPDGSIAEKIIGADIVWNGPAMAAKIEGMNRR